jgi:flagellar operon protein (TIGR03826 family)
MNLINCKECGKLFASSGSKVCPDCQKAEEEKFEIVKDFLWDNPNSTIKKVEKETGVERELIIKFMREDRLAAEGLLVDYTLKCKHCGKAIQSGVFCEDCRNKMISELSYDEQSDQEEQTKGNQEMFLKDRFRRK